MVHIPQNLPIKTNSITPKVVEQVVDACSVKPLKDYFAIKNENVPILELDANNFPSPSEAVTFNYVKIGKHSDSEFSKEIISFFNEKHQLIQRYFREGGVNVRKQDFINNSIFRTIVTYLPDKEDTTLAEYGVRMFNKLGQWVKKSTESQNVKTFSFMVGGKEKDLHSIHIKKVNYDHVDGNEIRRITLTKYPTKISSDTQKQVLEGTFVLKEDTFELSDVQKSENLDIDFDDKFLKYRFLGMRTFDGMKYLAQKLIKESGLEKLNILIKENPKSFMELDGRGGYFSPTSGTLEVSNAAMLPDDCVVNILAHEIQHAYDYALIGRLNEGDTVYERAALDVLGGLKDSDELLDALCCMKAKENYPRQNLTLDNPLYKYNFLEVRGREAGENTADEYRTSSDNYFFFTEFM